MLQTDVQKILRNARKLPDKTQTFYKVGLIKNDLSLKYSKKIVIHTFGFSLMSGAEPPTESSLGFRVLGAPKRSGRSVGERVHFVAGLSPSRCRFPALPCCTATETGQYWRIPVCCFWSQHCPHAHRLLQLSRVRRMNSDTADRSCADSTWRKLNIWTTLYMFLFHK